MNQLQEVSATGPLAAATSAGLLLYGAWLFLRLRHDPERAVPAARPHAGLMLLESSVGGPPPALALTASVFLHLTAFSLIPYVGMLAPGIVSGPPKTGFVLVEYRLPRGVHFDFPLRLDQSVEPPSGNQLPAQASANTHRDKVTVEPERIQEIAEDASAKDIAVARFDSVIQVFPPAAPKPAALGESGEAPAFVLDWRMARSQPGSALLAEIASFRESGAALAKWSALPEFSARRRFELSAPPDDAFANSALAEYGPAMADLLSGTAPVLGKSGGRGTDDEAPPTLRLSSKTGRRSVPYLISSVAAFGAAAGFALAPGHGQEEGRPAGNKIGTKLGDAGETPARPLERRRYGIILIRSGARGQIPEADGWLTGNPIYTVYLNVPGSARKWVLQYCRPGPENRRLEISNGVIRFRPRRALDPPFAQHTEAPRLSPVAGAGWQRAVAFANIDGAGLLSKLQLVAGPDGEGGEIILASLRAWEFLPAFEDGKPVAVEAIFSIPLD